MIFDPIGGALYRDDGIFIKHVRCPMALMAEDLAKLSADTQNKFCGHCKSNVACIDNLTEASLLQQLIENPGLCVFATVQARNIVVLHRPPPTALTDVTVVRTARFIEAMLQGFEDGFRPLVKSVPHLDTDIGSKLKVFQHSETGALSVSYDYREPPPMDVYRGEDGKDVNRWIVISDWIKYRPDYPFPLAAYLVPRSLRTGQRVFLDDLIEDIPIFDSGQGDSFRMVSAFAEWDGKDFQIEVPRTIRPLG